MTFFNLCRFFLGVGLGLTMLGIFYWTMRDEPSVEFWTPESKQDFYAKVAVKVGDEFVSSHDERCPYECRREIRDKISQTASSTEEIAKLPVVVCGKNEWGVFCQKVNDYCKTAECRRQAEKVAEKLFVR